MILIILPIKNESKTVIETANRLKEFIKKDQEVLFIDDDSSDGTYQRIFLFNHPRIKVIKNRFDSGKGSALKTGYIMSEFMYKMNGEDLICFLDGDGQIDPVEINTFINLMKVYNADVVIGNKRHIFSSTRYTRLRRIISKGYNIIIRLLFDLKHEDTQCGIKIFKKSALEKVIDKVNVKRYAFDLELLISFRENHFRIIDAPVKIQEQMNRGSIGISAILNTFFDTIKIWIKKNRGDYKIWEC